MPTRWTLIDHLLGTLHTRFTRSLRNDCSLRPPLLHQLSTGVPYRYLDKCLAYLVADTSDTAVFAEPAPGSLLNRSSSGFLQISSEGMHSPLRAARPCLRALGAWAANLIVGFRTAATVLYVLSLMEGRPAVSRPHLIDVHLRRQPHSNAYGGS